MWVDNTQAAYSDDICQNLMAAPQELVIAEDQFALLKEVLTPSLSL